MVTVERAKRETAQALKAGAALVPSRATDLDPIARYFPDWKRESDREHSGRAMYGQSISGSQMVVEFMKYVGADFIFGIPGGASLPLNDCLTHAHVEGAFRYVLTGHEQGAAFEAEGYALASGKCGWCTRSEERRAGNERGCGRTSTASEVTD